MSTPAIVDHLRACSRCRHVLVDEDELGWYYQVPVTSALAPGLTFMDRIHECEGKPHAVTPVSRCGHAKCGKAIVRCETLPAHFGCSSARGWIHVGAGAHACEARFDGPYAEPEEVVHWTLEEPDQPCCDADVDAPVEVPQCTGKDHRWVSGTTPWSTGCRPTPLRPQPRGRTRSSGH